MGMPTYNAAPLAKTFLLVRALQLTCFVGIIAITANFIAQIVAAKHEAPTEIIATVSITSLAALYTLLSFPFFLSTANIGLLVMCAVDFLLDIAFVVLAVVLGRPLASLNCFVVSSLDASVGAKDTYDFTQSVGTDPQGQYAGLLGWARASEAKCLQCKAAWGACVALCILFTVSSLILPALFAKQKRAAKNSGKGYGA